MSRTKMLIVDDNDALCQALKTVFEKDYELAFAASGEEALVEYQQRHPQVVLMDYKMPGLDGLETLQRLRSQYADSKVVFMSAYDDIPTVVAALRQGAADFVGKPFNVQHIQEVVAQAAAETQPAHSPQPARRRSPASQTAAPVITQREIDEMINRTLRFACV